ncbi:MAG TPA: sugar transferase [Anaerolineae bacterium]|nr:sugar transferase [Anaerolineae bacterium]
MVVITKLDEKLEVKTVRDDMAELPEANDVFTGGASGGFLKRAIDFIGSAVGLVLLSPLFLVIAILIRIDSPGPAIFAQRRIGKGGKEFTFYKFRSMYQDCDNRLHQEYMAKLINSGDEDLKGKAGCFKIEDDPRVTRVGRILRKSSLDELPQLINVFKGDMSLVGPRPALPYEVKMYEPWHARRLSAIPGITGLWQVGGRSEKNFKEMVELDLKYIDNWSVWLDMKILLKTFQVIFNRRGAW